MSNSEPLDLRLPTPGCYADHERAGIGADAVFDGKPKTESDKLALCSTFLEHPYHAAYWMGGIDVLGKGDLISSKKRSKKLRCTMHASDCVKWLSFRLCR